MRQSEIGPILVTLVIYALLAYGIYLYVKKKKHSSQPAFKSFLIVVLPVIAIFIGCAFVILIAEQVATIPRNPLVSAGVAAVIICCIIGSVRWSFAKIKQPVEGYVPDSPIQNIQRVAVSPENGLKKSAYIEKYRVTEKALDRAIAMKQIRAEVVDCCLYIEDRKL